MTFSLGTHYTPGCQVAATGGCSKSVVRFGERTDTWSHLLQAVPTLAAFGLGANAAQPTCRSRWARSARSHQQVFTWIPAGGLQVDFGLRIDQFIHMLRAADLGQDR